MTAEKGTHEVVSERETVHAAVGGRGDNLHLNSHLQRTETNVKI